MICWKLRFVNIFFKIFQLLSIKTKVTHIISNQYNKCIKNRNGETKVKLKTLSTVFRIVGTAVEFCYFTLMSVLRFSVKKPVLKLYKLVLMKQTPNQKCGNQNFNNGYNHNLSSFRTFVLYLYYITFFCKSQPFFANLL